jgi:lysophospholipase L1-like esterase
MAGDQLFFEVDGHPNRAGYRVIAEEVLAYLSKQNPNFEPAAEE